MFPTAHGITSQGGSGASPEPGEGYRYYRLLITENNGDAYLGFGELELYTQPNGASQSPNAGIATASSEDGANYLAANAFDGNSAADSPNWRGSAGAAYPQWVQKAFDAAFPLDHYAIVNWTTSVGFGGRAPRAWELQGSNDGMAWDTLDERFGQGNWAQAERRVFDPAHPDVLYRLFVTANNGDTFLGIAEIELYETVGGPAVPSNARTSTGSNSDATNLPQHAWDGNSATSWRVSFGGGPHWTQQFFSANLSVAQYGVRNWHTTAGAASRAPRDWELQRSTDGGASWTVLHSVVGETGWTAGELRKFTI